jgi:hypothetical protein
LREKRRLRVYENTVLRIFGPKRDEVTGQWRKLHSEELHDLYSTHYCAGDKIGTNEMGAACSPYGEGRGVYRVLVWKPEGKRPLGRPRRRWEDKIKMHFREVLCGDWTGLSWLRIDRWRALRVP